MKTANVYIKLVNEARVFKLVNADASGCKYRLLVGTLQLSDDVLEASGYDNEEVTKHG